MTDSSSARYFPHDQLNFLVGIVEAADPRVFRTSTSPSTTPPQGGKLRDGFGRDGDAGSLDVILDHLGDFGAEDVGGQSVVVVEQ